MRAEHWTERVGTRIYTKNKPIEEILHFLFFPVIVFEKGWQNADQTQPFTIQREKKTEIIIFISS